MTVSPRGQLDLVRMIPLAARWFSQLSRALLVLGLAATLVGGACLDGFLGWRSPDAAVEQGIGDVEVPVGPSEPAGEWSAIERLAPRGRRTIGNSKAPLGHQMTRLELQVAIALPRCRPSADPHPSLSLPLRC